MTERACTTTCIVCLYNDWANITLKSTQSFMNFRSSCTLNTIQIRSYLSYGLAILCHWKRFATANSKLCSSNCLRQTYECSKAHDPPLWDCMTYTLSRMGNHRGALDLILTQIGSIEQAIEFVKVSIGCFSVVMTLSERKYSTMTRACGII